MPDRNDSADPGVAPFESCIRCYRGDTTTALGSRGEAEWHIAALAKICGMSFDVAVTMVEKYAASELGCEPGTVPDRSFDMVFRLCRACADQTGLRVAEVAVGGHVPTIVPPIGPEA